MPPLQLIARYLGRVWSALSQLLNVVFLFGNPNESISGRTYRMSWLPLMRVLDFVLAPVSTGQHCRGAYNTDRAWAIEASKWPERVPGSEPPNV